MIIIPGVAYHDIHPFLTEALLHVVDPYYRMNVGYEATITSARDKNHGRYSRHYVGLAVDLRTWISTTNDDQMKIGRKVKIVEDLLKLVGPDFLILAEATHLHMSYKPNRPPVVNSPWS